MRAIYRSGILVALVLATAHAYATSGRTDAKGCHTSKKVGYHCHKAPAATAKSEAKPAAKKEPKNAIPKNDKAVSGSKDQPGQKRN